MTKTDGNVIKLAKCTFSLNGMIEYSDRKMLGEKEA